MYEQFWQSIFELITSILVFTFSPIINYFQVSIIFFGLCYWLFAKQLNNRKINNTKSVNAKQLIFETFHSTVSQLIFTVVQFVFYSTFDGFGFIHGYKDFDGLIGLSYLVFSIIVFTIIHDTYFYWIHRMIHHKSIFRFVHKIHHTNTLIDPMTSVSFNSIEAVLEALWPVIALLFLPLSPLAFFIVLSLDIIHTVYIHLGYEILPHSFVTNRFGKHIVTSTYHSMHHEKPNGNYGLYFLWWDWAMNTIHKDYTSRFEQLTKPQANFVSK
jgi:Delta7-sterol 5-desaturase